MPPRRQAKGGVMETAAKALVVVWANTTPFVMLHFAASLYLKEWKDAAMSGFALAVFAKLLFA
jgi:hypothetical protein